MVDNWLWWRDGVIYQIYPRSYMDSNGDGIGDLPGIISKLDYIKDLGVDAIWLSPIYPSPDADFGYDVADYTGIDPKYGTMHDFEELIKEAHQRKIHIIMDLVLNHTSDQHPWFLESRKSKDNPYRDWYIWKDAAPGGGVPNNWHSVFGGKGWKWDENTQQYYFHMFYEQQPDLNWHNPDVRQAILDVWRFWLDKGVDGFRLDVFNAYFKSAGFENNPTKLVGLTPFFRQHHLFDLDQPEMKPLLTEFREILDEYPERYAVGETFMADQERAASYTGEDQLHAAFDLDFLKKPFRPGPFYKAIQHWEQVLDDKTWPNYVLNNHDEPRSATRYTRNEKDDRLFVLAALILTLRGTPYLYYGEEIGMRDIPIKRKEDVQDPIGKRFWPFFKGRDGCRSPMQWNASPKGGFTSGDPWLPLHENVLFRNVENQQADSSSLYHFYKKLIHIRRESMPLRRGMYMPITFEPRRLLAYTRQIGDETVLVALNFSRRKTSLVVSSSITRQNWELLLSNKRTALPVVSDRKISLAPYEALLLKTV
jgi:alpha-glucosidase